MPDVYSPAYKLEELKKDEVKHYLNKQCLHFLMMSDVEITHTQITLLSKVNES